MREEWSYVGGRRKHYIQLRFRVRAFYHQIDCNCLSLKTTRLQVRFGLWARVLMPAVPVGENHTHATHSVSHEINVRHLFIITQGIIQPTVFFLSIAGYFRVQFYVNSCFFLFGFKILYQTVTGLKKDLSGVQKVCRTCVTVHLLENSFKGYKISCQVLLN